MTTQLVKLCYRNILETSDVTVTTENSSFPKYRLYDRDIGKLFKGTAFASPFSIILDQGQTLGEELISNGGMETGTPPSPPTGWTSVNTPETLEMSTVQKHAGSYSIHVVDDSPASYGGFAQNPVSFVSGKSYQLSFWYWIVSGTIRVASGSGGLPLTVYSTTGSWQYAEITGTVGAGETYIYFLNNSNSVSAEFYIDDVSMKEYVLSSHEVDRLIIPVGHNLNGLACSLRYSTDNFAADDHEAIGWTQGDALIIDKEFTAQTKRYWKLNITAPATIVEMPEMFLTKSYTFERNPVYGLEDGKRKNVLEDETQSGRVRLVKFGEPRKYRNYQLTKIESTQKTNLQSWDDHCEGIKPLYLEDHEGNLFFASLLNKDLIFDMEREDRWGTRMEFLEVL